MSNNFYDILWVTKNSSTEDIKKAYRKMAMKYHPDRNKGDAEAEKKFKEVNEAYSVLSDPQKKQQYDTFGSAKGNPFQWGGAQGFSGFEDIFGWFWGAAWGRKNQGFNINIEDLFGGMWGAAGGSPFWGQRTTHQKQAEKKPETLDFEKTYEIPVFDLILGCKIEVSGVYGQKAKLKIPASTKPGSKFRVKEFGKSEGSKKWNLIVKVEALMPKNISDVDMQMLERIRENIGY